MKVNRIMKNDGKITKSQAEVPAPIYSVRIKQSVYEPLVVLANKEGRSVTAQINYILEGYLKDNVK